MKEFLPVIINVYRIKEDSFINKLGINLFHTAIEYDNTEYAFGYCDDSTMSGIYDIDPMSYDEGNFFESIKVGNLTRRQFFNKLDIIRTQFIADSYNIVTKNCNHFTNDFLKLLFDKELPRKYKRFLQFGEILRRLF
jgi:hypothetical protein